jgi:hypothetical protein
MKLVLGKFGADGNRQVRLRIHVPDSKGRSFAEEGAAQCPSVPKVPKITGSPDVPDLRAVGGVDLDNCSTGSPTYRIIATSAKRSLQLQKSFIAPGSQLLDLEIE